jgi:hypothetical protein
MAEWRRCRGESAGDETEVPAVPAVAIATLAALVTACAVFAPLYDRAMQQALTDLAVDHTDQEIVGLQLRAIASDPRITFGVHLRTRSPTPEAVPAKVPAALRRSCLAPVPGYAAVATVPRGAIPATDPGARTASTGQVLRRDGACDHLAFASGGCPARPGDIAISEADARIFGLPVGLSFPVPGIPRNGARGNAPTATLTVSGVYRQPPAGPATTRRTPRRRWPGRGCPPRPPGRWRRSPRSAAADGARGRDRAPSGTPPR